MKVPPTKPLRLPQYATCIPCDATWLACGRTDIPLVRGLFWALLRESHKQITCKSCRKIYIPVYVYTCTYTGVCVCIHTYTHIYEHICIRICMRNVYMHNFGLQQHRGNVCGPQSLYVQHVRRAPISSFTAVLEVFVVQDAGSVTMLP